jgi:hypothetical protein
MRKYRKLLISALLLVMVVALGFLLYRRTSIAPEAIRLLPEGDRLGYVNLQPVHLLDMARSPVQLDQEYRDFIDQTGIHLERDLDEAAISRRDTPDGKDVESSEIFVGRFDAERLKNYLQKLSTATETYRDHTVFSIPNENHTVRVCILDGSRVAVTNMAAADSMHGIIDQFYKPSQGPSLLADYYHDVPVTSVAWLIGRIPDDPDGVQIPGGLSFTFPAKAVAVASLRYNGALLCQADVFAQSESDAKQIVDSANTHLTLARSIAQWMGAKGPDKDVKAAFASIQVQQKEKMAVFTATIPPAILKKIWAEAQPESPAPSPLPSPTPKSERRKR